MLKAWKKKKKKVKLCKKHEVKFIFTKAIIIEMKE